MQKVQAVSTTALLLIIENKIKTFSEPNKFHTSNVRTNWLELVMTRLSLKVSTIRSCRFDDVMRDPFRMIDRKIKKLSEPCSQTRF